MIEFDVKPSKAEKRIASLRNQKIDTTLLDIWPSLWSGSICEPALSTVRLVEPMARQMLKFALTVCAIALAGEALAINPTCPPEELKVYEQSRAIACTLVEISRKITDGNFAMPKIIHHFGKREYLENHARNGTVSKEVWDEFIMGEKTRFKLHENRRGLYGTVSIDSNFFSVEKDNWLMRIHIKDECRGQNEIVAYHGMPKTKRFQDWFKNSQEAQKRFPRIDDFVRECYQDPNGDVPASGYTGNFNGKKQCADFVSFYLNDSKVKIVQDHAINKSFYIRDRNCIETVKALPDQLIESAVQTDLLWVGGCEGKPGGLNRAYLGVILHALADLKTNASDEVLERLNKSFSSVDWTFKWIVDAYKRCREKGKHDQIRAKLKSFDIWRSGAEFTDLCQ